MKFSLATLAVSAALAFTAPVAAMAQTDYPTQPVTIIVPQRMPSARAAL